MTPLLKYSPVVKYGIPEMTEGSADFERYWKEEIRRCREGYKPPDGVWIPGSYYRHLNWRPMRRKWHAEFDKPPKKAKILSYALYRDVDHELHQRIYDLRNAHVRIGIIVLSGRRKGKSDDIISIAETDLLFNTSNEVFYCTPDIDALAKGISKFETSLNHAHPQMSQPFIIDNVDQRKLGMVVGTPYGPRTLGSESILYTSQIPKSSIFKGGFYNLGICDEYGTFKKVKLSSFWGDTKDCFKEGGGEGSIMGFMIFSGTIDQVDYGKHTDGEDFWRNADALNMDRFLIEADRAYGDYIDLETGQSDREGARKVILAERKKLEVLDDKTSYWKEVQNNPLNEDELFLITLNSKVNVTRINEQIIRVNNNRALQERCKIGELIWEKENRMVKSESGTVYKTFYTGRVLFVDKPGGLWRMNYEPINHIYADTDITAVDDFLKDDAPESESLGGIVTWRRFINLDEVARVPTMTYLGRPKVDDFHDEALKCAVFTKSRAAIEKLNDMMKKYFLNSKRVNGRDYLKTFPYVNGKFVKESDAYGYDMQALKEQSVQRLEAWTNSPYIENCFDIRFLKQVAIFGKQNSDLGSAAAVALAWEDDMSAIPVKRADEEQHKLTSMLSYQFRSNGVPLQVLRRNDNSKTLHPHLKWMQTIHAR